MKTGLFTASLILLLSIDSSFAQATRTWVSGVGDDANPGSRTAPCKTFAGAISKTAVGGEIDALDSGGFGTVTITKSITISGVSTNAGILSSFTSGVTINGSGTAAIIVTLRNLSINGAGTGTVGVRVLNHSVVRVDHCEIQGIAGRGIDFVPTVAGSALYLQNSHIFDCTGEGVYIKPTVSGTIAVPVTATIQSTRIEECAVGVHGGAYSSTVIHDSSSCGNGGAGFETELGATMALENTESSQNGVGINAPGGTIRISNVTVMDNAGAGLAYVRKSGFIKSWHTNKIGGNNPDGGPSSTMPVR